MGFVWKNPKRSVLRSEKKRLSAWYPLSKEKSMGDKSPKSKKRDQVQKARVKEDSAAKAKAKQERSGSEAPAKLKKKA